MRLALLLIVIAQVPAAERFQTMAECEKSCASPRRCVEMTSKLAVCGAPCAWDADCEHGQICKCVPTLERECARTETRDELRMCFDAKTNICEVVTLSVTPLDVRQRDEVLRFVRSLDYTCKTTFSHVNCEYAEPLEMCRMDARVIDELLNASDLPAQVRCGTVRRC
jgi:hypothetical protein